MQKTNKKIQTQGIILNSFSYGESNKIFSLFTPASGTLSAMAHGARKYTSRFRGKTESLTQVECLLHRSGKSAILVLEEIRVLENFSNQLSYETLWTLFPFLRALSLFHFENADENQKIYSMLEKLLKVLCQKPSSEKTRLLLYSFLIKAFTMTGMTQNFKYCFMCLKENKVPVYYLSQKAQIACRECQSGLQGFRELKSDYFYFLVKIIYSRFEEIINLNEDDSLLSFLKHLLEDLYLNIFEKRWDDFEKEGNPFNHQPEIREA